MSLWFFSLILINGFVLTVSQTYSYSPFEREDVIGQYRVSNEKHCHRLCWYRASCSSYSYNSDLPISKTSVTSNCILHSDSEKQSGEASGWVEKSASSAHIGNKCNTRPCDHGNTCVPTSSISVSTSVKSVNYVCLSLPSQCDDPGPVPNGDVIVTGYSQGDVARVKCASGYVPSPKSVSVQLVCLETSQWTTFNGTCVQYEFSVGGGEYAAHSLPWPLEEHAKLCVRGVFTASNQLFVNLMPEYSGENVNVHISFRYQFFSQTTVVWTARHNSSMEDVRHLGDMPLVPGDSFQLTLHVQSDRLQLVLNEEHVYNVPLLGDNYNTDGVDLSHSSVLAIGGPAANVTYMNLLHGCD